MKVTLEICNDLGGGRQVGFMRFPHVFHTIARAMPGETFSPSPHYPCDVCADFGVTLDASVNWWKQSVVDQEKFGPLKPPPGN